MGFEKVGQLAATLVIAAALIGHLDSLNHWVQVATAKLVWESRTSTWGSPRFWPESVGAVVQEVRNHSLSQKLKIDHKVHSESGSN